MSNRKLIGIMKKSYVTKSVLGNPVVRSADLLDCSSSIASLQRKADLADCSAQHSRASKNNQKMNVVQCMGQDEIEAKMGGLFEISDAIDAYGGLCGGWSLLMLEDPETASEIWKSFELYDEKKAENADQNVLKENFMHVVNNQLRLSHADESESALSKQEEKDAAFDKAKKNLERFVSINGEYDDSEYISYVSNCEVISYEVGSRFENEKDCSESQIDRSECEIEEKRKIFIKNYVLKRVVSGKWLLSTDNHYMSISFNKDPEKCLGFVSETNQTGIVPFVSMENLEEILVKEKSWKDDDEWFNGEKLTFKCYAKKICE